VFLAAITADARSFRKTAVTAPVEIGEFLAILAAFASEGVDAGD
jgi:hypothetical protein